MRKATGENGITMKNLGSFGGASEIIIHRGCEKDNISLVFN